ncbi:MAG: hypothetical protein ACI9JN_000824 [Bacteroidia bacterium]|jgi:hypothetical protein
MNIHIEKGQTVMDVKHQFGNKYKGLKLEMFKKAHDSEESSNSKMRVFGTETIDELVSVDLPVHININPEMTVSEVESAFEVQAGLHAQIFRKMRNIWIETVQTDGYTLAHQMDLSAKSTAL